ncbi:hypothetical protein [Mucilaginibacter polytrichastri]|uniref:Uncharacterized protein n=1 Tax=Mucilaginibacter polytrichastri TaxID=1302689 RepID=A0A1Q6A5A1_9SPHI|nr:hypothetical protein [Mucilaginibacter polytrichastri]OKS89191.1 hypothetical protein RG47T_4673 [Mucilaginibacter polytrichastri]SFS97779.1 hypothetical protein SAMN04487890_107228 [Mucilaginibacter polytrichastri]
MQNNSNIKRMVTWALLTNMLILVGLGNGTGFMVIVEAILIPLLLNDTFYFSLSDTYAQLLPTAALLSLIGQVLMIISLFRQSKLSQALLIVPGLLCCYGGLLYLTINAGHNNEALTGMITAVPFVCVSALLLYNITSNYAYKLDEFLQGSERYHLPD